MAFCSWSLLADDHMPELGSYAISPWFGFLLQIKEKDDTLPWWLGFSRSGRVVFSEMIDHQLINPTHAAQVSTAEISKIRRVRSIFNFLVSIVPLGLLVFGIRCIPKSDSNFCDVLLPLNAALGVNINNTCLVDSLVRMYFLRGCKQMTLNIGVLIPTTLMHAWIEVNSEPLHECPDRLIHFSRCIRYRAGI